MEIDTKHDSLENLHPFKHSYVKHLLPNILAISFCQDTFTTSEGKAAFTTLVHPDVDDEKSGELYRQCRNGFHGESIYNVCEWDNKKGNINWNIIFKTQQLFWGFS